MKFSLMTVLIFASSLFADAQDTTPTANPSAPPAVQVSEAQPTGKSRPRIGLVLEGGGALGLAHVGVLRWFEEHHIPIDYVSGTSMGGLVGGLYATGRSGSEIEDFVQKINWNRSFRNELPYQARSFRRKEDKQEYPNDLEFGLKGGIA